MLKEEEKKARKREYDRKAAARYRKEPPEEVKEIAAMVPMSTTYVAKFYRRITAAHPALEPLVYDRLTK